MAKKMNRKDQPRPVPNAKQAAKGGSKSPGTGKAANRTSKGSGGGRRGK
jgi:hypothetical protein